jgi:predicted NUDIX family NTP pyrophosphohydrolase
VQHAGNRLGLVRESVLSLAKQAVGILLYRRSHGRLEVLLAHPGGPLWTRKDVASWTLPKGQFTDGELPLDAAKREFGEEMGSPPSGDFQSLGTLKQPSGKVIHAWAAESDFDATTVNSNLFTMEWPPKSGKIGEFPEVDRAEWLSIDEARVKILKGQAPFLDRLLALLK